MKSPALLNWWVLLTLLLLIPAAAAAAAPDDAAVEPTAEVPAATSDEAAADTDEDTDTDDADQQPDESDSPPLPGDGETDDKEAGDGETDDGEAGDGEAGDKETGDGETDEPKFSGQADLDEATKLKITAAKFEDLGRVIELCETALRKGLDEQNREFARQLMVATRLDRAMRITSQIFDRKPPPETWPRLARVALVDLELAVNENPDIAEAHLLIGRILALPGGNRARARESLDKVLELAGEDGRLKAQALTMRGNLTEDADKKLADFDEALRLLPDHVDALRARGLHYMSQREHEKALADFRRAVELEPENAKTHEVLALELLLTSKLDEARQQLDAAIKLSPEEGSAFAHRARIYAMQNEHAKALEDINRALKMSADNLGWRLLRAQIHQQMDDTEAALADVERLLVIKPDMTDAIRLQASLLAASDRLDEGIAVLERAAAATPDNHELTMHLSMFYTANRQPLKAIAAYDKLLAGETKHWSIYRGRADALLSIGRQAEAIADYAKALELEPGNSGVLNNLAWVLATSPDEKLRDGQRAIKLATEACEATEYGQAHILSTLAAGHAETGDFETAIKWSQKAFDLGEGETKEQLGKELQSYKAGEPWREVQNILEEKEEAEATDPPADESSPGETDDAEEKPA